MDNNLLIAIGADTNSFDKAVEHIKTQYKTLTDNISKNQLNFTKASTAGEFAKTLNKMETDAKKVSKELQATFAKALGIEVELDTDEFSAESKAMLARYERDWIATNKNIVDDAKRKEEKLATERKHNVNTLMRKWKYSSQARYDSELKRINKLADAEIAARAKVDKRDEPTAWGNIEKVSHAIKTTALYGAAAQMLFGLQDAYRAVGAEIIRFDQSLYTNQAVLGKSREEAFILSKHVGKLARTYGTSSEEIHTAMLTIGRAGVDGTKEVQQATTALTQLAMVTGDSMSDGAAGLATMLSVYPELNDQVDILAAKMGVIANATRLGIKDFTTISNYALTTAKSIGLTEDAYLGLAGAMSKVGLNASTIGTSIRRLKKFTDSASEGMTQFYRGLGVDQKTFRTNLQSTEKVQEGVYKGMVRSTAELIKFSRALSTMSKAQKERYSQMTKGLNILEKSTVDVFTQIGSSDYLKAMIDEIDRAKDGTYKLKEQADKMALGMSRSFIRVGESIKQAFNEQALALFNGMFDRTAIDDFDEAIQNSADTIINIMKYLIQFIASLAALKLAIWLNEKAFSVWTATMHKAKTGTLTLASGVTFLKAKMISLLDIFKRNWVTLAAMIAFEILYTVITKNIGAQDKFQEALKTTYTDLKAMNKVTRDSTSARLSHGLEEATDKLATLQAGLTGYQNAMKDNSLLGFFFDYTDDIAVQKQLVQEQQKLIDILKNKLGIIEDLNKEQSKEVPTDSYSAEASKYKHTPEDVAYLKESALLQLNIGAALSKQALQYSKLNAEAAALGVKREEIKKSLWHEKALIKVNVEIARKEAQIAQFRLKLHLDIKRAKEEGIKADLALEVLTKKRTADSAALVQAELNIAAAIEDSRKATEAKKTLLASSLKLTEDSVEVLIAQRDIDEALTAEKQAQIEKINAINAELDTMIAKINAAVGRANSLATALGSAAAALALVQIDQGVVSGKYNEAEAKQLRQDVALKQNAIVRANTMREMVALQEKITKTKKKSGAQSEVLKDLQNELNIKALSLSNIYANQQGIILEKVKLAREANKQTIEQSYTTKKLALEQESGEKRFATAKEHTIEKKKLAVSLTKLEISKYTELLNQAKTQADLLEYSTKLAQLKGKATLKEQEAYKAGLDSSNKAEGAANRADSLLKNQIQTMRESVEVQKLKAEYTMLENGYIMSKTEALKWDLALAQERLDLSQEAYDKAVEMANLGGDTPKAIKEVAKAEKKLWEDKVKYMKVLKKEVQDFNRTMQKIGDSFADSLLSGDVGGAFKNMAKDIMKVFVQPLKDEFSKLFGNKMTDLIGGFYKSLTGFMQEWAVNGFASAMKVAQGNAVAGVAAQGQGDPYTAWARMAMMAATMAALGLAVGAISGGSTVSQAEKDAAMGRTDYDDDSLTALSDAFEDAQYPMLEVTNKMHKHLRNMDANFYGIARALNAQAAMGGVDITGVNFADTMTEGFLGFSSETITHMSSGIKFYEQSLAELIDAAALRARAYTTSLVQESSWWGLSSSESIKTTYKDLPSSVINNLADAFNSGYDAIMTAGVALGLDSTQLMIDLLATELNLGKIDFTGLSPDEVSERLSQAYSTAFSDVIKGIDGLYGLVDRYATGSEYALETLGRIALEFDQASHMFMLIGKDFKDGGIIQVAQQFENIKEVTEEQLGWWNQLMTGDYSGFDSSSGSWLTRLFGKTKEAEESWEEFITRMVDTTYTAQMQILDIVASTGGLQAFNDAMGAFMGNFYTDAEQLKFLTKSMEVAFATLDAIDDGINLSMPKTNDEFRKLLETMDTSTEEGAYLYGQILLLAESFAAMTDAADSLGTSMTDMVQNVTDAWLGSLSYLTLLQKEDYANKVLALGLTDETGTINTVDAARAAAEIAIRTTRTKEEYIPTFERYITELEGEVEDASNTDLLDALHDIKDEVVASRIATIDAYIHTPLTV